MPSLKRSNSCTSNLNNLSNLTSEESNKKLKGIKTPDNKKQSENSIPPTHINLDYLIELEKEGTPLTRKQILSLWDEGDNNIKLSLIKKKHIDKLESDDLGKIIIYIAKMKHNNPKDYQKFFISHNLMLGGKFNKDEYTKYISNFIDSEDTDNHQFLAEHVLEVLPENTKTITRFIQEADNNPLITVIKNKKIHLNQEHIEELWYMERIDSVLQLNLLECERLDSNNYVKDEDISKFITSEQKYNGTDVADMLQKAFDDMKKRRENNDIDKKMPAEEYKDINLKESFD